jgi:hypothetical protein
MRYSQEPSARGPRTQPNAAAPGSYEVALRVANPLVAPGETVQADVFFSGYGEISQAKLFLFPSSSVFAIGSCTVRSGLLLSNHQITWGADPRAISANEPLLINFSGVKHPDWADSTCFVDGTSDTNLVYTEMPLGGHAPVEMRFATSSAISTGKSGGARLSALSSRSRAFWSVIRGS